MVCAQHVVGVALVVGAILSGRTGSVEDAVRWKGRAVAVDALPGSLDPAARAAVASWMPWARERSYTMSLSEDGRVLLLMRAGNGSVTSAEHLVARTQGYLEKLLGVPGEDADVAGPEAKIAVLIQASTQDDYRSLIELACERESYLRPWSQAAKDLSGFTLAQPLWSSWLAAAEDLEEYDPQNELVNRLTQLILLQRFDRFPYWLQIGMAWQAESELKGNIFCFPYRNEFVSACEHNAWQQDLRQRFAKVDALDFTPLAEFKRGSFDPDSARMSWGAAKFLAERHPDRLATILSDFEELYREKGIVHHPDGTWTLVPDYQPSVEDELAVLQRAVGEEFLSQLLTYYKKGK